MNNTSLNLQETVGNLVTERPSRARIFEKLGIDYCCGGKKPLEAACADKGLDPREVAARLAASDDAHRDDPVEDWNGKALSVLARHITDTHHAYLREALPRIAGLLDKVAAAHGARHPEMLEVRSVFTGFASAIEQHLAKEETVLFPMLAQIDGGAGRGDLHCGTIGNPIRVMMLEHDDAGEELARMRELAGDYVPPSDACNTFRVLLHEMEELEADTHRHIHLENNVLFPMAASAEDGSPESRGA